MRVLFISNLFPNPIKPHMAAFSRQQIEALSKLVELDVIAPVPWNMPDRNKVPSQRTHLNIDIYHPVYWYTPGVLRSFYGSFFHKSIHTLCNSLFKDRGYDLIYSTWLYPDAYAALQLSEKYQVPLVVGVLGTDVNRLRPGDGVTLKSVHVANRADHIVSVSNALKERLVAFGVEQSKITLLHNGVNRSIFYPMNKDKVRSELDIDHNEKRILFVGNLLKTKGLHELVSAFSRLIALPEYANTKLDIIGAGPFLGDIRQLISKDKISGNVNLLGSMAQVDIARWMNACDVFCLPSYSEGQPNVVLEALACEAPVVATNVGGIPELARFAGEGNVALVDAQTIDELVSALVTKLSSNCDVKGNDFIQSWQQNAQKLQTVFNSITKKEGLDDS